MPLFAKHVNHFGFLPIKWNMKGVNKILVIKWLFLIQQVSLYFSTIMQGKRVSKNITQFFYFSCYKGKSAKEIAPWNSKLYHHIPCCKRKGRLDLKVSIGRPKKVKQRVERKITKTVYDSPKSNTVGLALQVGRLILFSFLPKNVHFI